MEIRHHVSMAFFDAAKALNEGFFYIVMVAFSIYLAVQGQITIGSIATFSALYLGVMAPLREVHRILDDAHESSIRVGDLMQMIQEPLDDSYASRTLRPPRIANDVPVVLIENLTMEYRTLDGRLKRALDDVSLTVRRGETIGVAGPCGSGKSTWLKIVMRLVHPTRGRVLLGGEPIQAISREDIGRLIGYVSQVPFVFAGTVAENIAYGIEHATQQDIERAAKLAHIHDAILAMPGGYHAKLAERGQNLSGGQRQQIALARIFLKNPPILILDEATSALDNVSEKKIQQAVKDTAIDRTVIMIAHRLSTLRDADRILVFDQGRIAEAGTYQELFSHGGVFTTLVRSAEGVA
jgi:ATP-binding cassette subfamily B protein